MQRVLFGSTLIMLSSFLLHGWTMDTCEEVARGSGLTPIRIVLLAPSAVLFVAGCAVLFRLALPQVYGCGKYRLRFDYRYRSSMQFAFIAIPTTVAPRSRNTLVLWGCDVDDTGRPMIANPLKSDVLWEYSAGQVIKNEDGWPIWVAPDRPGEAEIKYTATTYRMLLHGSATVRIATTGE